MKNKFIAAVLAASLLPSVIHAQSRFTDMKGYDWAEESVETLYEKGIVTGTSETEYSPAAQIKRGDFALMTARCFGLEASEDKNLGDVPADAYYADAVMSLKTVEAYNEENFEPERAITREEAVGLIYNVIYNTTGVSEEYFSEDAAQFYSDAADIKWDKVNAAASLTKMGIIEGDGGQFKPKNTMTRAEMAVVFFNLEEFKSSQPEPESEPSFTDLTAKIKITSDMSENGKQYNASENNESVILLEGASYTATSVTFSKVSGGSFNAEESRTKGLNSAFAAINATADMRGASILSSTDNSDALFADNSRINLTDSALVSTGDNSSSAGSADGSDVNIINTRLSTAGKNSPSLKTLYTGTITGEGIFVMTSAADSPGIYSAGKTVFNNSTLSTEGAYAAQIDGKGELSSYGSSITGGGIMFLQSNKTGSQDGMGKFSAYNSKILTVSDALFYVTNTDAEINLTSSEITVPRGSVLLKSEAGQWGNEGANGGHASVNAQNQALSGDIVTDGISSAALNLIGKSSYKGALNPANYTGAMNISMSTESTWELTADSYITAFINENAECSNIISNGYSIYYDPSAAANVWLEGKTIQLGGGGVLKPAY